MIDAFDKMLDKQLYELEGVVIKVREKSVLLFCDEAATEVFVPRSIIQDWWFNDSGRKKEFNIDDLELNDEVTFVVPLWYCRKEGLV